MSDDDSNDDENVSTTKEKMDDVSRDQLDKIKARTMYNMVEPLDSGNKKLLFLTNAQALLLASEPQSMEKMLLQLDINEPQLVINLLHSPGKQLNTVCWIFSIFYVFDCRLTCHVCISFHISCPVQLSSKVLVRGCKHTRVKIPLMPMVWAGVRGSQLSKNLLSTNLPMNEKQKHRLILLCEMFCYHWLLKPGLSL